MTRSAILTDAAGARGVARATPSARFDPAAIEFPIVEDNGGARDGAASARLDRRAGEVGPVDLAARRDRRSDELDAERWLDEGGSFSSEAVARWQAPH